jgi:SAM-dependent methyltransferase
VSGLVRLEAKIDTVAALPRVVDELRDCFFYHTTDIDGHGVVNGEWDLRGREAPYLGEVELRGKRVLELGTADGFLSFHMERQGAEVVSYDLSPDLRWDVVPFARGITDRPRDMNPEGDWVRVDGRFRERIAGLNNAYWFCHSRLGSNARLVHGDVYSVPFEIGNVDVTTFGALLLHTRDPFGALARALALTSETVIVTEQLARLHRPPSLAWMQKLVPRRINKPAMRFLPEWRSSQGADGWWRLSPEIVVAFVGVLGFERSTVSYHTQLYKGQKRKMFTVVGHRTV